MTIEIYWNDLTEEKQQELLNRGGIMKYIAYGSNMVQ